MRLRTPPPEAPARSPWLGVVATLLAFLALAQGAYIWYMHAAEPVVAEGHLRVDGPDGAEVRLDGERVGIAPLEQDLATGVYQVEVVSGGQSSGVQRVSISLGRTVVVLPLATPAARVDAAAPPATGTPVPPTSPEPPATAVPTADVSDTTGAVEIASTPPGLSVTMGGRARGVTPLTVGQVKPGRHDVLVGGLVRQVDVRAGQVTTLRVSQ